MLEYEEYYIFNSNSSDYQTHTLSATYSHKFGKQKKTNKQKNRYMQM